MFEYILFLSATDNVMFEYILFLSATVTTALAKHT